MQNSLEKSAVTGEDLVTSDFTGCLAQVQGHELSPFPKVIQLLGEAIGHSQPLQLLRRAIRQPTEQWRQPYSGS